MRISAASTLAKDSALKPLALLSDNGPSSKAIQGNTDSSISPCKVNLRPVVFSTCAAISSL